MMPYMAYLIINRENQILRIIINFVSLAVITEIDNWYGAFFEIFLDAYFKEETLDHPQYL